MRRAVVTTHGLCDFDSFGCTLASASSDRAAGDRANAYRVGGSIVPDNDYGGNDPRGLLPVFADRPGVVRRANPGAETESHAIGHGRLLVGGNGTIGRPGVDTSKAGATNRTKGNQAKCRMA